MSVQALVAGVLAASGAVAYSPNAGQSWGFVASPLDGGICYGVAAGNNQLIICGGGADTLPTIASTSSSVADFGDTWSTAQPFSANVGAAVTAVAWSGELWVATCSYGIPNVVATSPDGVNWTLRSSPFDGSGASSGYGVTWNGTVWLVCGVGVGSRCVMTSPDGINWTVRDTAFDTIGFEDLPIAYASAWSGNTWVVVGGPMTTGSVVMTNPNADGSGTWSIQSTPMDSADAAVGVSVGWGGSTFVVGGNQDAPVQLMTSPDGATWAAPTNDLNYVASVYWDATSTLWYAGGSSAGYPVLESSGPAADSWSNVLGTAIDGNRIYALTSLEIQAEYLPVIAVAGGYDANGAAVVMTTSDGVNWYDQNTPFNDGGEVGDGFNACATGPVWLCCGNDANDTISVITSSDGITWTGQHTPFDGVPALCAAWNGFYWVLGGTQDNVSGAPLIATSTNGTDWTPQSTPLDSRAAGTSAAINSVAWNGSLWVAVAVFSGPNDLDGAIITSPDGINWTRRSTGVVASEYLCSVIWIEDFKLWITGGSSGDFGQVIWTSLDGVNWTVQTTPIDGGVSVNPFVFGLGWNGKTIVAACQAETTSIMTSSDSVNWATQTSPLDILGASALNVAWDGIQWLVGTEQTSSLAMITSLDSTTWTALFTPFENGGQVNGLIARAIIPTPPAPAAPPNDAIAQNIIAGRAFYPGPQPSGPVGIPHLQIPIVLTGDGSFAIWQQDTIDEVCQSVEVICGSTPGVRTMVPTFGLPETAFTVPGANPGEINSVVATWDPRALITVNTNNTSTVGESDTTISVKLAKALPNS